MFIERVDLEKVELAYPGAISEDLDYGAFSKRFITGVGRVAGASTHTGGEALRMLVRRHELIEGLDRDFGVIRTDNFPGVSHKHYGRSQVAVTVDSFLDTMRILCEDPKYKVVAPVNFGLLVLAGNSILSPDEPPLVRKN